MLASLVMRALVATVLIGLSLSRVAFAEAPSEPRPEVQIQLDAQGRTVGGERDSILPTAPPEAPPPSPYKKSFVIDTHLGALGFLGEFRRVAPTAIWLHTQFGYELFKWLMFFGEGELAFTDTSTNQDASKARAFPIVGFGGGTRLTLHMTTRVALFGQGDLGLMKADVANNAFTNIGYRNAERFNPYYGGRIGVEWYQVDRHLALGLAGGIRNATGFARTIGKDNALMWDTGISLRYTF